LVGALVGFAGACSDDDDDGSGSSLDDYGGEDQACYPNHTCDAGLKCDVGRCKVSAGSGGDDGGDAGAHGGEAAASAGAAGAVTGGTATGGTTTGGTTTGGTTTGGTTTGGTTTGGQGEGGATGGDGMGGASTGVPGELRPMPNSVASGLPNPAVYDAATPGVVVDEVTRLVWERSVVYSFVDRAGASGYCSDLELGGQTDWRLPSRLELVSLLDYDAETSPAIDKTAFPDTPVEWYWTASVFPDEPPRDWQASFYRGNVQPTVTPNAVVRCVRGEEWGVDLSLGTGALEGIVIDSTTGLMWQQSASASLRDLAQAQTYCGAIGLGGHEDWRLPSVKELQLIVDDSKTEDFSYDLFFDDPELVDANLEYWSSTQDPTSSTYNFGVQFLSGRPSSDNRTATNRVRCVRP
jgi:hypothetical protein